MTLVVIAAAQILADDVDPWGMPRLRALLPVAGMTVIEQQAMRARALGARRMLIEVDGIPGALAQAMDRIRALGLEVEPVRDSAAVMAHCVDASRLLLVADGLVADEAAWKATGTAPRGALLTAADMGLTQMFERIDADTRWAGLAMIDGAEAARLAEAPANWDAQLVLLRQAVQLEGARIAWDDAQFVSGAISIAASGAMIAEVERQLLAARTQRERGLGRRFLIGPVVQLFAGRLLARQRSGTIARALTLLLAVGAGAAMLAGHPWAGMGVAWAACWSHATADFIARFRPETRLWERLAVAGAWLQLVVVAIAERGSVAPTAIGFIGNGGIGAMMLLALSMLMIARDDRSETPLLDLAAAWPLMLGVGLLAGRDAAVVVVSLVAAALLGVALRQRLGT